MASRLPFASAWLFLLLLIGPPARATGIDGGVSKLTAAASAEVSLRSPLATNRPDGAAPIPVSASAIPDVPLPSDEMVVAPEPALPDAHRGQSVTLAGENLATDLTVYLTSGKSNENLPTLAAYVGPDRKSVRFEVPKNVGIDPGRYFVSLVSGEKVVRVPGELRVLADDAMPVELESVSPSTVYPADDGTYTFYMTGKNFAPDPTGNLVEILDEEPQSAGRRSANEDGVRPETSALELSYVPGQERRMLKVVGFQPRFYHRAVDIRLVVAANSSTTKSVVFSCCQAGLVRLLAVVGAIVLGSIVFALVKRGIVCVVEGKLYSAGAAFFLDPETNSYSLSKFQLVAWTGVAVFAYVYILLCYILVQCRFGFPDVPGGLPGILGLSAGTTVLAVGMTAKGLSKGAGPLSPSMADFVTSGGLVASDRFQFFVWTLVGCTGFLGLLLSKDPAALQEMPRIPDGLLYLMGVSATGYLAGKFVRTPGPVVRAVEVMKVEQPGPTGDHPNITIRLGGDNLSSKATIAVDGVSLAPYQYALAAGASQIGASDRALSSELTVTLRKTELDLATVHTLMLTNGDGQMAQCRFPLNPLTITSVDVVEGASTIAVTGANFGMDTAAEWVDVAGKSVPVTKVVVKSETSMQILVPAVRAGKGRLTLRSTIGLTAVQDVDVAEIIQTVGTIKAGTAEVPVALRVSRYSTVSSVIWKDVSGAAFMLGEDKVQRESDGSLVVRLVPGGQGTGELTVVTPSGYHATKKVPVA